MIPAALFSDEKLQSYFIQAPAARLSDATIASLIKTHFDKYTIYQNVKLITLTANAYQLNYDEMNDLFDMLRKNIRFFEEHGLVESGLFNIFMYGVHAIYGMPETIRRNRVETTLSLRKLLNENSQATVTYS